MLNLILTQLEISLQRIWLHKCGFNQRSSNLWCYHNFIPVNRFSESIVVFFLLFCWKKCHIKKRISLIYFFLKIWKLVYTFCPFLSAWNKQNIKVHHTGTILYFNFLLFFYTICSRWSNIALCLPCDQIFNIYCIKHVYIHIYSK